MRILDALGFEPLQAREASYRDDLLPVLAEAIFRYSLGDIDTVVEEIDSASSVALASVAEDDLSQLASLAAAVQVLAEQAQFARLRPMARRFRELSTRFEERPYLAEVLVAFAHVLVGDQRDALVRLNLVLGLNEERKPEYQVAPLWTHVSDVLLTSAFRHWLEYGEIDRLQRAKQIALNSGDGSLLTLVELFISFAHAIQSYSTSRIVEQHEGAFRSPRLQRYLKERGISPLFPAQRQAIESGALAEGSKLIAMPTSSGKTFIAELRILAELARNPEGRVIYLTPYRLLARQVEIELRDALRAANHTVKDMGSGYDFSLDDELALDPLPTVAIMTPERLDALMRLVGKGRPGSDIAQDLLSSVVMLVLDEIQLLGRPSRGPKLELIVARLRQNYPALPILGLAALATGVTDLASWLGSPDPVSSSIRPTGSLEVLWRTDGTLVQRFGDSVTEVARLAPAKTAIESAAEIALRIRPERYPILIVETKRNLAESVIEKIRQRSSRSGERWRESLSTVQLRALSAAAELARVILGETNILGDLIEDGLAFHHAGVPGPLLREIENLARMGAIRVIGATTTVAEGAHLPFQVVIIPHLNFPGPSGRLEKDLYQNIVGRAGRVNVAVEGMVISIGSTSKSLGSHVEAVLWNRSRPIEVRGQLTLAIANAGTEDDYRTNREIQSQVLAWVGDPDSYVENQASHFARQTFSWSVSSPVSQAGLEAGFQRVLRALEDDGLAEAASPYRLTALGERSRLAGLGPKSCLRLARSISSVSEEALTESFSDIYSLDSAAADLISSLVFEAEEVLEQSVWFRRYTSALTRSQDKVRALLEVIQGTRPWPVGDELFQADRALLSGWIQGKSFAELAMIPPVIPGRGAFSGEDLSERTSDAAEQLGRIAFPAAWAWSAVAAILGSQGNAISSWIRDAIEYGLPSQTATNLVRRFSISRSSAVKIAGDLSPVWEIARDQLGELDDLELTAKGVPARDKSLLP